MQKAEVRPQVPANLLGHYNIVGRVPNGNAIYNGKLSIDGGKTAYSLKRTVNGVTTTGKAWLENCVPDGDDPSQGELVLEFEYDKKNGSLHGFCYLTNDLQNSMPLTCYTDTTGVKYEQSGFEAAFPEIDN